MSSSPFPVFYEKLKDGSNKKIISFSIYGEKPLYYLGAELNIKEAKEIYPGWICRFYCTKDVPNLEKLKELDCEVIVPDLPSPPIYWRILACDDPNVDVCIQRDSDSVVNSREKVAVDEWINSDKTLHFMHDCSQGHFHKIMAGMWGIKKTDKFDFTEELISFFKSKNYASIDQDNLEGGWGSGRATYFDDQNFLSEIMYNCFSDDYMEHGQENDFPPHEPLKYGGFVGDRVFASEVLVDDNFLDKDEIFIQSHLSIDDQMPLNGMIRHLHETGKKIIFAVRELNLNLIKYCLSDLDNLEFKILVGDEDGVDSYAKDYDLSKTSLLALGNYGRQIHNVSDLIDKCYMQANLPVEYKSSKFFIPEDIEGDTQLKPQELEILNKYKSNLLPAETIEEISLKIDPSISKEPFAAFVLNENGEVNLDKILQRPKSTHGFLIDGLRELSEKYIKPNSTIVEIGCYMGESAEIFLESGNVDKIYCVDPWENNYDSSDESSHKAPMEFVEKSFDDRVSRFGDKVVKLKMTAERAFELIADESVDLVYLDGEHTYEANERYLNLYNPKLKHDGYMCGHDWGFGEPGGTGHSQTEAIRRFFKSEPMDIFQDNSWVYKKKAEDNNELPFNKAYCINLDKRPDRWESVKGSCIAKSVNVDRFSASTVRPELMEFVPTIKPTYTRPDIGDTLTLSNSEYGVILSNIAIWKKIVEENIETTLILEDDVVFKDDAVERIAKSWSQLPEDWDLVQIAAHSGGDSVNDHFGKFTATWFIGNWAYALNLKGANKMMEIVRSKGVSGPLDNFIGDQKNELNIYYYLDMPGTQGSREVFGSNIQHCGDGNHHFDDPIS
jgi:GR25 family glycosyltransferase involved in LPS biosynthesis/predicted O-methyltransferase YrrM